MINELLQHTLAASRQLVTLDDATINRILIDTASALLTRQAEVLAANVEDLSRMDRAITRGRFFPPVSGFSGQGRR